MRFLYARIYLFWSKVNVKYCIVFTHCYIYCCFCFIPDMFIIRPRVKQSHLVAALYVFISCLLPMPMSLLQFCNCCYEYHLCCLVSTCLRPVVVFTNMCNWAESILHCTTGLLVSTNDLCISIFELSPFKTELVFRFFR